MGGVKCHFDLAGSCFTFPHKGFGRRKNSKVEEISGPQGGGEKEGRRGGQDVMEAVEKK